jgi:hypothetical protein
MVGKFHNGETPLSASTPIKPKTAAKPKAAAKTRKPAAAKKDAPPTAEQIAHLAEKYCAERGRPHGSPEHDWLRAEQELMGRAS